MNERTGVKALAAMIVSLALYAGADTDARADDSGARALFYVELPLSAGHAQRESTFGFRLDSGRIAEGGRWPLLNLQTRASGGTSLRLSGVPVFGYAGEESVKEIPWWGWGLGALALACLVEAGICKDDDSPSSTPSTSSPGCPTCGS